MAGSSGFNTGKVFESKSKTMTYVDDIYVTELFGELYFKESSKSSRPSLLPQFLLNPDPEMEMEKAKDENKKVNTTKTSRTSSNKSFPPIRCIDCTSGKPSVILKSYRHDGRLIMTILTDQEFQHASKEGCSGKAGKVIRVEEGDEQ